MPSVELKKITPRYFIENGVWKSSGIDFHVEESIDEEKKTLGQIAESIGIRSGFSNAPSERASKILSDFESIGIVTKVEVAEFVAGVCAKKNEPMKGLLLYGPTGSGKSTIARAICEYAMNESRVRIAYFSAAEIRRKYLSKDGDEWLCRKIDDFKDRIIVLDDLGVEGNMTKYGNENAYQDWLYSRAESFEIRGIPTIYTTNLSVSGTTSIRSRYGERIADRIEHATNHVLVVGRNWRSTSSGQ